MKKQLLFPLIFLSFCQIHNVCGMKNKDLMSCQFAEFVKSREEATGKTCRRFEEINRCLYKNYTYEFYNGFDYEDEDRKNIKGKKLFSYLVSDTDLFAKHADFETKVTFLRKTDKLLDACVLTKLALIPLCFLLFFAFLG